MPPDPWGTSHIDKMRVCADMVPPFTLPPRLGRKQTLETSEYKYSALTEGMHKATSQKQTGTVGRRQLLPYCRGSSGIVQHVLSLGWRGAARRNGFFEFLNAATETTDAHLLRYIHVIALPRCFVELYFMHMVRLVRSNTAASASTTSTARTVRFGQI